MAPVAVSNSSPPPSSNPHISNPLKHIPPPHGVLKSRWRPTYNPAPRARADFAFDSLEDALTAYKNGEFLIVMDDENRENEGDLIIAASECTTEKMAWMIKHTSGFICIALPQERLEQLQIPMMSRDNQDSFKTAYTITVDFKHGTTTGISAHDRALTARSLSSPLTTAEDFNRPGHLVPLRAAAGGTLVRRGHTEAAVDLCALASLPEHAGVLCEVVEDNDEGSMMRRDGCRAFADRWGIKMISIDMIAAFKRQLETPDPL